MTTLVFAATVAALCVVVCWLDQWTRYAVEVFQVLWAWAMVGGFALVLADIAPWPAVLVGVLMPPAVALGWGATSDHLWRVRTRRSNHP